MGISSMLYLQAKGKTMKRTEQIQLAADCYENAFDMKLDPWFADQVDTPTKFWKEVRRQFEEEAELRRMIGKGYTSSSI